MCGSYKLVNGLDSFVCQHFMNITSQLNGDIFECVDGWGPAGLPDLDKLSMRSLLERGHSRTLCAHTDVWDAGNPLVSRQTDVVPSMTLFLLHLTSLDDVRAAKQKHK